MQERLKKILIFVLVVCSWILFLFLVFDYFQEFNTYSSTTKVTNALELISYLFFITSFSYSNVNWFYTNWKKVIVFIANPSVVWKITTIYTVTELDNDFTKNIFLDLSDKYIDLKFPNSYNSNLSRYEITINNEKYILSVEKPDNYEIRVISEYRISYRKSLKNLYDTYSEIEEIIRMNFIHPRELSYILTVQMDNYNPFYKVYLSHFEKIGKFNFSMNYDIDEAEITVQNNKISIYSSSLSSIKNISNKYVAISNNNLFQ